MCTKCNYNPCCCNSCPPYIPGGNTVININSDGEIPVKSISKNGVNIPPDSNKNVNIIVPTLVGELTNDVGYITSADIPPVDLSNYYTKPQIDNQMGLKADKSNTYTKTEIDQKFGGIYKIMPSVPTFSALPTVGNIPGDVRNVLDTGANYVWTSDLGWDKLSETVDLSEYYTKTEVDDIIDNLPVPSLQQVTTGGGSNTTTSAISIKGSGYSAGNEEGITLSYDNSGKISTISSKFSPTSNAATFINSDEYGLTLSAVDENGNGSELQLSSAQNLAIFYSEVRGLAATNPNSFVTKAQLDATSGGNLQSITTGAGNNVTSNAIQVTGGTGFDVTTKGLYIATTPTLTQLGFISGDSSPAKSLVTLEETSASIGFQGDGSNSSTLTFSANQAAFITPVEGIEATLPNHLVTKSQLDASSGGTLQSVTTGVGNNITSNALQVGGSDELDIATPSLITAYNPSAETGFIALLTNSTIGANISLTPEKTSVISKDVALGNSTNPNAPRLELIDRNLYLGVGASLVNNEAGLDNINIKSVNAISLGTITPTGSYGFDFSEQSPSLAGIRATSRVSGSPALNNNEFVTKSQLDASTGTIVGSGLRDDSGTIKLGSTDGISGLITEQAFLLQGSPSTITYSGSMYMPNNIYQIISANGSANTQSSVRVGNDIAYILRSREGLGNQQIAFQPESEGRKIVIIDDINDKGLEYYEDYSANFTDHSLVTKKYVDDNSGSIELTNGLYFDTDGKAALGGNITEDTILDLTTKSFSVVAQTGISGGLAAGSQSGEVGLYTGGTAISRLQFRFDGTTSTIQLLDGINNKGIEYPTDYSANFTEHSLVTKKYVDNSIQLIDYPVDSVNGKQGPVVLTSNDINSDAVGLGTTITDALTTLNTDKVSKVGSSDIEITDFNKGIILRSPDNSRWRITVGNDGALTTTKLV